MSPFNHQDGICGADVTAPGELHHSVATAVAMCTLPTLRRTEATLARPGGPREEQELTSLTGKASLQRGAVACLPRGSSALSRPRGSFPRGLPRRSRLGLNEIRVPIRTGPQTDRSMGTLVPTGPTVAPGPMMGTLVGNGRMRSVMGPKCPAGPGHVESSRSAARATFSSTITGAGAGPAHVASQ